MIGSVEPTGGELDSPLLDRPAEEVARRLARRQIERARRALAELAAGEEPEALHDLRVALRRLRSLIRAFAVELRPTIGRKLRRRLRRLAAATNPGRDAEVGHATVAGWLAALADSPARRAAAALATQLAARRDESYRALDEAFRERASRVLDCIAGRLAAGLEEVALETPEGTPVLLRTRVASELANHRGEFERALADAVSGDVAAAHRARIEAKRLRYLLEPLAGELAVATPVRRLVRLQDLLGELNDLALLAGELGGLAGRTETEWIAFRSGVAPRPRTTAGGRAGRTALARRLADERAARQVRLRDDWLAPRAGERGAVLRELVALGEVLS